MLIEFLASQAAYAHWYAFGLLLLAGFNMPVSEDIVIISSAVLAATVVPENFYLLIIFPYLGVYFSDQENYWLARLVGPKILEFKITQKIVNREKLDRVKIFLDKYGPFAILGGRFIPFGFRNGLFMTCGISRMVFWKFALFDFIASVITTTILFSLGYSFGKNYEILLEYMLKWKIYIFIFAAGIILLIVFIRNRNLKYKKKEMQTDSIPRIM